MLLLLSLLALPLYARDLASPAFLALEAEWGAKAAEACVDMGGLPADTPAQRESARLLETLGSVPSGRALLALARERGALLCQGDMVGQKAYWDDEQRVLALKKSFDFEQKAVLLAHELQHLHQNALGYRRSLEYSREEAVRFTFAMEADAQAIASVAAWQLGPAYWRALRSFVRYRAGTLAFAAAKARGASDAEAARESFKGWLANDWLTAAYRGQAFHIHLDELDKSKKLESYRDAPEGYYARLCRLPDGFAYDCQSALPSARELFAGPMMPALDGLPDVSYD